MNLMASTDARLWIAMILSGLSPVKNLTEKKDSSVKILNLQFGLAVSHARDGVIDTLKRNFNCFIALASKFMCVDLVPISIITLMWQIAITSFCLPTRMPALG